jgi:hypothetical protein
MSWSTSFESQGDHSANITDAKLNETYGDFSDQVKEQFATAKNAARIILLSQSVGNEAHRFRITLSGHANPNHEPQDGFVNDTITARVDQL